MILDFIEFLRARSATMIKLFYCLLSALVIIDVFVEKHPHISLEKIPGFWAVFGFLACSVLIIVARWFGRTGIETEENYYD